MTDVAITIKGDMHALVPGATYLVQVEGHHPPSELREFRDHLNEATGAKFVVLCGAHLLNLDDYPLDDLLDAIEYRQKQRARSS